MNLASLTAKTNLKFVLSEKKTYGKKGSFLREIILNRYLYLLALPGIIFFFIFAYLPIIGLLIAFQDFNPIKGIWGSEFIGLKNFIFFFTSADWTKVTFNTLFLNILFILSHVFASIIIALLLSEINAKIFKRITQSIAIFPHFLSWTVIALFSLSMFSTDNGFLNTILKGAGLKSVSFYTEADVWPLILVIMRLWRDAGFGSIIYLASITGIDQELYNSAKIDGASRLQCIFYITIPLLKNVAILLLILGVGKIFYGDFGMIYALIGDNPLLYSTTDVIDTFVFRALREMGDIGMGAAVGFYQSIIGFILVITSNTVARKYSPDSAIF